MEKTKQMDGWGGPWSNWRELFRSGVHVAPGIAGWILLLPVGIGNDTMWLILTVVGGVMYSADVLRRWVIDWTSRTTAEDAKELLDQLLKSKRLWLAKSVGKVGVDITDWLFNRLNDVNEAVVRRLFTRASEDNDFTTIGKSIAGFVTAWVLTYEYRWIAAMVALLFAFVDPIAKLGYYFPVKRIESGRAKGKSWGGALFGWGAALLSAVFTVAYHLASPILPAEVGLAHIFVVYLFGAAVAPLLELYGGKWDNFFIPAGSAATMVIAHWTLNLFGV